MIGFLSYDSVGRRISGARRTAVLTTLAACCVVLGACAAREPKAPQFAHVDPDKQSNESFNERLRDSSQNLLHYLKRKSVYHYLVDRFGQVFRVVEEKDKANHAGMSVWSVGDRVYLNLNGPTIGVSFETRWEGGRALPITRAQLEAGRRLTDYLRYKWSIEPALCTTHGLASVNPRKHLIGHHVDWARGFPFTAFGLEDQYAVPTRGTGTARLITAPVVVTGGPSGTKGPAGVPFEL